MAWQNEIGYGDSSPGIGVEPHESLLVAVRQTAESKAPPTEGDLVSRAQAGDAEAFEGLYKAHVGRVYGICLRMVTDPGRAEELTQDVFVRAWNALSTFRQESAFGTWLHRLAVNVVLNALRAAKRRAGRVMSVGNMADFEREVRAAMPDTRMDLERAIAHLPGGARDVLILHDIEGYRYREIADLLDIAEGTVKSQLSRARRLVREALNK